MKNKKRLIKPIAITMIFVIGVSIYANWDETKEAFMEGWNSVPGYESPYVSGEKNAGSD